VVTLAPAETTVTIHLVEAMLEAVMDVVARGGITTTIRPRAAANMVDTSAMVVVVEISMVEEAADVVAAVQPHLRLVQPEAVELGEEATSFPMVTGHARIHRKSAQFPCCNICGSDWDGAAAPT
jgi:hypothetical protein